MSTKPGQLQIADDSGRFAIPVAPPQALVLDIRRIGFRPTELALQIHGDTSITITMSAAPGVLAATQVTVDAVVRNLELSGFYRRMRDRERGINAGHFITVEEIERRNPVRITHMLQGIPSLRVMRQRGERGSNCLSPNDPLCWVPVGLGNCPMTVYLDGRRLNDLSKPPEHAFAFGVDALALPTHVAGIEVYTTGGRAPPEYQSLPGPRSCGVILIWTR